MKNNQINELVANLNFVIGNAETKTQKKLQKIYDKIKDCHKSYQEQIEELRLDNCEVDEKGMLLLNDKSEYRYTKDGVKKLTRQIKELGEKEFDFKPIEVVNPQGLEEFIFLKNWVIGVEFINEEEL